MTRHAKFIRADVQREVHSRKWRFDMSPEEEVIRLVRENKIRLG